MIIHLLLCNIIYIPLILCINDPASKLDPTKSQSEVSKDKLPTVPLLSEGGSIMPETLLSALPKETNMSGLNHDLSKSKVFARKGVDFADNTTSQEQPPLLTKDITSLKPITPSGKLVTPADHSINSTDDINVLKGKSTLLTKIDTKTSEAPKIPKKPLILHSDVLENMTVKSTMAQSTSKEIYKTNANDRPGMVMPIVITILLVPMFAVFGYMALRRGQEAWKNRHYKRTDFLLDGMYND